MTIKSFSFASSLAAAAALSFGSLAAAQTTLLVDDDAPPGGTGTANNWSLALNSLQDAITIAQAQSSSINPYTIKVAEGTYRPLPAAGVTDTRRRSFTVDGNANVRIIGGYRGNPATVPPVNPDGSARRCILSGTAFTQGGQSYQRAFHVFQIVDSLNVTSPFDDVSVENFTITGGRAWNGGASAMLEDLQGGGIRVQTQTNVTVAGCIFYNNYAGPSLSTGHTANLDGRGGAIFLEARSGGTQFRVRGSYFVNNSAEQGGAIAISTGNFIRMGNCVFRSNGMIFTPGTPPQDVPVFTPESVNGGAVWLGAQTSSSSQNCLYHDNEAREAGGAVYWRPFSFFNNPGDATHYLTNCTVAQNAVLGDPIPGMSGVFGYQTDRGAGLHVGVGGQAGGPKVFNVHNCILWDQIAGPDMVVEGSAGGNPSLSGATISVRFSDYYDANAVNTFAPGGIDTGGPAGGNISMKPAFANAAVDNFRLITVGPSASPCLDTGNTTLIRADVADVDGNGNSTEQLPIDLDGAKRVEGIVNMGAFENE